jgi:hypothetical protein
MASSYKYLGNNDRVVSATNLNESVSSSFALNGWTSSSYDYYLSVNSQSSPETHVFDVTFGRSGDTDGSGSQKAIYNQFAKILLGYDEDNNIQKFSLDSDTLSTNNILHNAYFLTFPRSQFKDKIKRGTFSLIISGSTTTKGFSLVDKSGSTGPIYREAETGEVGLLFVSSAAGEGTSDLSLVGNQVTGGLIFYEAGVAVISPYIFSRNVTSAGVVIPSGSASNQYIDGNPLGIWSAAALNISHSAGSGKNNETLILQEPISNISYGLARAIRTASYQATTELNSTIYFCRAFNNEFNYSSNPTYLSASQIVVKNEDPTNPPVSYITTVGLYDDANQLLAVAKLSEPIKKTPDTELIARVRLDF